MKRILEQKDIPAVVALDTKWFGEFGTSAEDVQKILDTMPNDTLGIFDGETLLGFATFDVIENGSPRDYVGDCTVATKTLFIQQFTTVTNYKNADDSADMKLLVEVEQVARDRGCRQVWIPLSVDHPYSKEKNPAFDAFGFFKRHAYTTDENMRMKWSPNADIAIDCFVFYKQL
jgi:hypothetical protein